MRVRFWGTRGSIATPGPGTLRYGGNTSCVEVRSAAGTRIIIDCGTGLRALGRAMSAEAAAAAAAGGPGYVRPPVHGHVLISHTHWDHIQGVPFFDPFFAPANEWDVYAPRGLAQSVRETLAGQMQYTYFPITLEALGANIRYHDLVEGGFRVGDVRVRTQYLNHPALTLGYRLEADGATVVYACDHEPHARRLAGGDGEVDGQDRRHADFLAGADLVIHDAQFTADEYPTRVGWGHSPAEYVAHVCRAAGVRRVALTHHDPNRDDAGVDRMVEAVRRKLAAQPAAAGSPPPDVFAAAEGLEVELGQSAGAAAYDGGFVAVAVARAAAIASGTAAAAADDASALNPDVPALAGQSVLLVTEDEAKAKTIADAVAADDVRSIWAADAAAALRLFAAHQPCLVLVARHLPHDHAAGTDGHADDGHIGDGDGDGRATDGRAAGGGRSAGDDRPARAARAGGDGDGRTADEGLAVCRAIRSADTVHAREVPVVVMDRQEDEAAGAANDVTDWLVEPFTPVYARTRVRAWLLRAGCRWERAPAPPDEPRRLAALRRLNLLDTAAEERFDRLTRLAAATFDVPTAFVTLVDEDRQWLKSCVGTATRQTGRDVSFCAHAILGPDVLVVPDTLLDPRFADNPLVTGGPRIRFYAGYPLVLPDRSCVGTLCVVDTRPREFSDADVALLRDLGALVRQELTAGGHANAER